MANLRQSNPTKAFMYQCNLQKSKLAQLHVNGKVRSFNKKEYPFIFLIQEPFVGKDRALMQPNSCKRFAVGNCPRATIYTSQCLNTWAVEELSNRDTMAICVEVRNQTVLVISSYLDYNDTDVIPEMLEKAVEFACTKGWALIIGCDSNCHSVLYGKETNKRGEKLEEFIATHNLSIENIGQTPTYESRGNKTIIDITLSRDLTTSISNWRVDRKYNASDHNSIMYELACEKITIPKQWKWYKADWDKFSAMLAGYKLQLPENIKDEDCETAITDLYRAINRAMKSCIPQTKQKTVDKNNPWWTHELKLERAKVSKLYKAQNKTPTDTNVDKYKKAHQQYKANCLKARKISWRNFQTGIDSIQSMNTYRKIIEGNKKAMLGTLTREDGSITNPGSETIEYLLKAHFRNSTPVMPTCYSKRTITKKEVERWDCDWLTEEKIVAVFDNFKNKKSPGTDNISPIIL